METMTPASPARPSGGRAAGVPGTLLAIGALGVFAVTWIFVAAAVLTDGGLLADTWAWLTGLEAPASVVAWVVLLPLAVFLWAWQADPASWAMALVMAGLVGWTLLAVGGLRRRMA
jgi:hypothetical protein